MCAIRRPGRQNRTAEAWGRYRIDPDHSNQQAHSRRANTRRAATNRTGIPDDLLQMWLGGVPYGDDSRWSVGYPNEYDSLRDIDALERWIDERGYPWVNPPERIEISNPWESPERPTG